MEKVEKNNKAIGNEECIFKGQKYRFTVMSNGLIRIEYSKDGYFNDEKTLLINNRYFEKFDFQVNENDNTLEIVTKIFKLEYKKEQDFSDKKKMFNNSLTITNLITNKSWHPNHLEARNLQGGSFSLDGYTKGLKMDKGLYSLDGFVSVDDSNNFIVKENMLEKNPDNYTDIYLFMYGKDFSTVLKEYYLITTSPFLIKRSMLGVIWNKNTSYTNEDVYKLVNKFKRKKIPLTTLILPLNEEVEVKKIELNMLDMHNDINDEKNNIDIEEEKNLFDRTSIKYPDELLTFLKEENINLGLTINTDIEFKDSKYTFFEQYYNEFISPMINRGVNIFLNEGMNKENIQIYNNIHFENGVKRGLRNVLLNRNFRNNIHSNSIAYSGHTICSWNTLKILPFYNNALSNNAISYMSHDIGGFSGGIEDDQLYLRYLQLGVFSPILRLSADDNRYYKRAPYEWDIKTYHIAKEYLQLRYKLIPYLYSECFNSIKNSKTLIEPLFNSNNELYFNDNNRNEYYLGNQMLISPIVTKKEELIKCCPHHFYLPNGLWYNFKDGKKYKGNKKHLGFFKEDEYPVFCKAGAIVPMSYDKEINNTYNPKNLELVVFPGQNNSYQLYEDNGTNFDYLNWMVALTNFEYEYFENSFNFTVKIPYKYPGIIGNNRNYKLRFKNIKMPKNINITLDDNKLYFISYIEDNDLIIMLEDIKITDKLVINVDSSEIEASKVIDTEIDDIINQLVIETNLKIKVNELMFSNIEVKNKRIEIRKLEKQGLSKSLIEVLLKLVEIKEDL